MTTKAKQVPSLHYGMTKQKVVRAGARIPTLGAMKPRRRWGTRLTYAKAGLMTLTKGTEMPQLKDGGSKD